jgi:peptide/nickel transport system permease protein
MVLAACALGAPLLASDLPLVVRVRGQTHWLPCVLRPEALRGDSYRTLRAAVDADAGAWMVPTPVPFGPNEIALEEVLAPPSGRRLLGTDELGRDVLARIIHGARTSLGVGVFAVLLYVLIGVAIGTLSGYLGGRWDGVLSRLTEVFLSFPSILLVLCILGVTRSRGVLPIVLVLGLTRWTDVSRIVRAEVLRLRGAEFVQASRALGAGTGWVITRHLVPNVTGPVAVAASFGVAGAILIETALSFLGFGAQPPAASWGELLTQAHRYVTYPGAWWLTVFPGVAIFLTVSSFHLVADAARGTSSERRLG